MIVGEMVGQMEPNPPTQTARDFSLGFQEFSYALLGKLQGIFESIIDRYYKWINDFDYEKDYDAPRGSGSNNYHINILLHNIRSSCILC